MQSATTQPRHFAPGDFPALLRDLARRQVSGRLSVAAADGPRQLWMDSGFVRAVVSEAEDEKLGKWLVAQRLLEPAQMALALLKQPDGVRFGAFLVQQGLLEEATLTASLERLATDIVARLITTSGEHTFVAGDACPEDATTIRMNTDSLIVAAVRRIDAAEALEAFLPGELFPCTASDATIHREGAQLVPEEAFLLSRVDGAATVNQLRRVVPIPRDALTRGLAALTLAGLVELRSSPVTRAAVLETNAAPKAAEVEKGEAPPALSADQQREYQEIVRFATECRLRDFYRRLGLTQGATLNQVHERYREFMQVYNPDRAREPHLRQLRRELAEITSALQEAYETLINPEKRARYSDGLKSNPLQTPEEQMHDDRRQRARRELARANVQRAQALVRAGDFGAAVQLLDEAVRAEPSSESLLLLARIEQRNPMWTNRVLEHLRSAVSLDPQFTEAWLEIAAFWAKRGQTERQRQSLEKVLAYDPTNGEVTRLLAAIKPRK